MSEVLTQSLWITLIGMGLVFAALVLLAGLISAMTRIFRDREALAPSPSRSTPAVLPPGEGAGGEGDKARAAALAVTVALAEQAQSTARPLNPPRPAIIGAWQLGMRTRQMAQKGEMKRRGKE
jgi:Na+-transporting methylmalonyl-CoA/oxaloacetate decarboxylase gamma subunit